MKIEVVYVLRMYCSRFFKVKPSVPPSGICFVSEVEHGRAGSSRKVMEGKAQCEALQDVDAKVIAQIKYNDILTIITKLNIEDEAVLIKFLAYANIKGKN